MKKNIKHNPEAIIAVPDAAEMVAPIIAQTEKIQSGWFDTEPIIDQLRLDADDIMKYIAPTIAENGLVTTQAIEEDGVGQIASYGDPTYAALIPGKAFVVKRDKNTGRDMVKDSTCMIANTLNNGFRFVSPNYDDPSILDDCGPVDAPVIIGNSMTPQALFVPLNNAKALSDAGAIANAFLERHRNNLISMVAGEDKECEGNCSCGGNCHCHDDEDDNTIKVRFI